MKLSERLESHEAEVRAAGKIPEHWLIRPDLLAQLREAGLLAGSSYAGMWMFNELPILESNAPGDRGFILLAN